MARSTRGWLSGDRAAIAGIVIVVALVHLPQLISLSHPDPIGSYSGLGSIAPGFLGGYTIDPNIGYTSQALGHRAMLDLISLHLPWWNPFAATGAPLAGEWQSAALFPPSLLLLAANGQVWEHVLLQAIAGISTYLLLLRVGTGRWAAFAAAAAFALNGTFAWLDHASSNPLAFLPLLLLGLEQSRAAADAGRRGGWWVVAVALALSIYAGFPEVAYIDGLLAFLWLLWRAAGGSWPQRRALLRKAGAGLAVGLLLSAPIALAGASFLANAHLGAHAGGALGNDRIGSDGLPQLLMPYVYGPIFSFTDPHGVLPGLWGVVGGYLSLALLVLGTIGLTSSGRRGLRLVLGIWILLTFARMYGQVPGVDRILGVLPDIDNVAFFRYGNGSMEMATVVLGGLGMEEVIRGRASSRRLLAVGGGWVAVTVLSLLLAHGLARQLGAHYADRHYFVLSGVWAIAMIVAITVAGTRPSRPQMRGALLTLVVVGDAFLMFFLPVLGTPRHVAVDMAPVRFLQRNLGTQRFFTLGPIAPNYGSYWGISSLNSNDIPTEPFARYVNRHLDPYVDPTVFVGNSGGGRDPFAPSTAQELERNLAGYRAAGVSYVLTPAGQTLPGSSGSLSLVKRTPTTWIYRLAGAAPLLGAADPRCRVVTSGDTEARLSCPAATTVTYRETDLPGWSATVGGRVAPISRVDGVFQLVHVPAGDHTVRFSYVPPHIVWGGIAFLIGLLCLAGRAATAARKRRRPAPPG